MSPFLKKWLITFRILNPTLLTDDDIIILSELKAFLLPFKGLTELMRTEHPRRALLPLIIAEIKDVAEHVVEEMKF